MIATAIAVGAAVGLLGGLLVPYAIRALPEPEPDPEPEEGAELNSAQRARLAEPPKEPYAELASHAWLLPVAIALSTVLGGLLGALTGWDRDLIMLLPLAPVCALLAIVDARTRYLPTVVVLPATAFVIGYALIESAATGSAGRLVPALIGLVVARSLFWIMWFVYEGGLGFGDVRLIALVGFVLGYHGAGELLIGICAPMVLQAVPVLVWALVTWDRSKTRDVALPLGPYIVASLPLALWLGPGFLTA